MKPKVYLFLFVLLRIFATNAQDFNLQRVWATYYGDESISVGNIYSTISKIDSNGNIYILGTVKNNPNAQFAIATPNAFQTQYGGGDSDSFITKFNPDGQIIWSTYFGGEGQDTVSGITIDNQNNIFIAGYTSSSQNIVSANAYQTNLVGATNGFLARFTTDGARVWCTYYGGGDFDGIIDIICDASENIFVALYTNSENMATVGTFQPTRNNCNNLIASFNKNGSRNWASYYGFNGSNITSIGVNTSGLFVYGKTFDCAPYVTNDYFATSGCHQAQYLDCNAAFLSKFSFNGQREWSTYYGDVFGVRNFQGNLVCSSNAVYISGLTFGVNTITTTGAFQEATNFPYTPFLVKFNNNGVRQWGTYCGKSIGFPTAIPTTYLSIDNLDNVYLTGSTGFDQKIATSGSYQEMLSGGPTDAFVVKFNPSGERIWGTYYGDTGEEGCRALFYNDVFYLVGNTTSLQNMATTNAFQTNFINNANPNIVNPSNIFITKFEPIPLSTNQFSNNSIQLYPNPNKGKFILKGATKGFSTNGSLAIYDALGRRIKHFDIAVKENTLNQEFDCSSLLSSGIYVVKLKIDATDSKTFKMIVN